MMTLTTRTNFNEAAGPHVSFSFGRMNPPHYGHEGLINTLVSVAKNGAWALFLSKSHDAKKNPLTYDQKLKWVKTLYPQTQGHLVEDPNIKTFLQAAAYLYAKGFRSATFVAGEDDMASMRPVLEQYNGKQVAHGYYQFEPLTFMESPRLTSATNAREAAKSGDPEAFERATRVPQNVRVDGKTLMQAVRIGMGLGESVEESITEAPGIGGDWDDLPKLVKVGREPYKPNVDNTYYGSTHGVDLDLYGLPKYETNEATEKSTKAVAKYQDMPHDGQRCDHCTMWRPPHGCSAVEGKIAANGWCSYYKRSHRKDLEESTNKNVGSFRGKPFWIGVFDTRDGHILATYTYEKAASNDFHHSFYVADRYQDAIANGEAALFWMNSDGSIETEWTGGSASPQIVKSIQSQLDESGQQIDEAASPVLFHYTGSVGAALNILKNNEFMLSISTGSVEAQYAPRGYNYFLSTTRSKVGGYHEFTGGTAVMFNLDGNWFNRRYPVKAIDYWAGFDKQKHSESEDRVFSREPTIPADAITAIHILLKEVGEFASPTTRQLMLTAKKRGLPTYLYSDENAWKLQDTKRAIPVSKAQDLLRGQKKTGYISTFNGKKYLEPWLELIFKKSRSELSKEANKLRYSLTYWNGGQFADDLGLRNEITNARKPGNSGYEAATKIIAAMRKIGANDVKGLLTFLHKKWDAEAQQKESVEEALDPNETHGWILPDRKVVYVTKEEHLGWLYSKDIDGYEEAFKLGYVRFAKATLTFFVQGFLDDLKKMYRVYAQTALGFKHIAVDVIIDESGKIDNQISLDYEMPKDKAKFIKKFGPEQKTEHANSILGTVGGGAVLNDRNTGVFPWDEYPRGDQHSPKIKWLESTTLGHEMILEEILNEVNMSPTALRAAVAKIPNAKAGLEFELIVTSLDEEDDEDYDPYEDFESQPDYDQDETIRTDSFSAMSRDIEYFFSGDHNSRREVNRAIDMIREAWYEYLDGPLWDTWAGDRIQDFIDKRYGRDYKNQEELFSEIDRIDPYEAFRKEYFEEWRDNIEDDNNIDDYLEKFLEDTYGGTAMSDLSGWDRLGLSWPHWTEPDEYDRRTRSTVDVGDFRRATGIKTIKSNSYHGIKKPMDAYVVEPDSSLSPTRGKGGEGLEFVSPPLDITTMIDQINKVKAWAKDGNAYTNDKTGLHMNISIPGYSLEKLDYVKLALFLGDKYILDKFGRLGNSYARSAFDQIASFIKQNPDKANRAVDTMRQNLNLAASKIIHSGYTDKFTSINTKDNRVEFRSPGGNWLDMDTDEVVNTLLRVVYAMNIALDPEAERQEYQKKFAKLLTADKKDETDTIKYFTAFATGNMPRTALISYVKQAQSKRDFAKKAKADRQPPADPYAKQQGDDEPYVDYTGIGGFTFKIISRITGGEIESFVVSPRITLSDVYDIATRIVRASGRSFELVAMKDPRDGEVTDILTRQQITIGGSSQSPYTQPMYIIRSSSNHMAVSQFRAPDNEQARDIALRLTREYGYRNEDWFLSLASDDTNTPIPGAGTQALQLPSGSTATYVVVNRSDGTELLATQAQSFYQATVAAQRFAQERGLPLASIAIRSPNNDNLWDAQGQLIPQPRPQPEQPRQYSQIEIDRGYDITGNAIPRPQANITATNGTTYNIIDNQGHVVHTFNAVSLTGARRYAVSYADEHNLAAPWDIREVPNRDESLEESILNEINMSPTSLEKFADTPFAKSMKVGFETEMYIPGLGGEEGEEEEEEDMDANENFPGTASYRDRQRDVMNFFTGGNGINTRREVENALELLYEAFSEYQYEYYDDNYENTTDWKAEVQEELGDTPMDEASERELDDAKDNVRTAWVENNEEGIWRQFLYRNNIGDMYDFMRWVNRNTRESLSWPYYTYSSSREEPTTDIGDVVDDFRRTTGYKARASIGYHNVSRDESTWIFEPDSSLDSPNNDGDGGIELVSPPMDLENGLAALENVFSWAKSNDYYTNRTTGFHIGVSIPNQTMENIDHLKVIMLLGDEYVLKAFGRAGSRWTKSSFDQAKREVRGRNARKNVPAILDKMRGGLEDIAKAEINKLLVPRGDRYVSVNIKPNYIEFRSAGGNYFEQYEEIRKTMLRYVRVMGAAADPDDARKEYQKKLYKFVSAGIGEKDNTMQLFAKYTAGAINQEQLMTELRSAQERRKPVAPLGVGPVDGFLEDENGEQVVKIKGTNPYEMIELGVKFANTRQLPLADINLRYPGYSMVRVQYYSTHQTETDSITLVYIPAVDLYNTYSSEITKAAIPVAKKYWGVSGLPQDRFAVRVLDEYSLSYMRDEMHRITTRGEDRAPTPPSAPPQAQAAPDANDDEGRQVRYLLKYSSNGNEVFNFSTSSPRQAKLYSDRLVRENSQLRWGGTIGGVRGVQLFRVDPNTQEQELFYMGPSEPVVNQPASGTPTWADDPNITVRNNTPAIRNPGGYGEYALFVQERQISENRTFMSYQDALSYFTPLANSSGFTGWSVKQLS